jgi:hypothetical protein
LAINLADLVRETRFYRDLRNSLIEDAKRKVIGHCLLDPPAKRYILNKKEAGATHGPSFDWHSDPESREQINSELEQAGYTKSYVLATANADFAADVREIEKILTSLDNRLFKVQRQLADHNKRVAARARKATATHLDSAAPTGPFS